MKLRQSSLDLYAFTEIYRTELEGSFIKKVYQVAKNEFLLQIHRSDIRKRELFISLTRGIAFYEAKKPEQATQLSLALRKLLSERKIMAVTQINFDRIVKFTLSTGQEMIIEMFREGNLIITDGSVISFAMNQREWKNRKILIGEVYKPPGETDPLSMDNEAFGNAVRKSKASLVQTLATRMNLGGEISEEVLHRSGIDKESPASELQQADILVGSFRQILDESVKSRAYFYSDDLILSPVRLTHLGKEPDRTFEDLNEGFVHYLENYPEGSEELTPLQRRLESQRKTIVEYNLKAEQFQEMGTLVISNIQKFQRFLDEIRAKERNLENGMALQGNEAEIAGFDAGKKTVSLVFQDMKVPLTYTLRATENANGLFSQSKDYRSRAAGAETAVTDTLKSMQHEEKKPVRRRRAKHWFEIYRWFFSSEGFLVVSGKDRKTNEKVVKKHLSAGDIYVHADLYGAPSTVIKCEGKRKPGDATIREACIFAVAQSRAWGAGLASGSAYWVYPEQVSKTPESGEYVSTGSWIVRGKRNYLFDLPLELEICLIEYSGETIPMIHPVPENGEKQDKYVRIRPGNVKRGAVVKRISEVLEVAPEDIEALLPPGGSAIEG